ncbi:MAG: ATP-binding cassette domain-containing protein [Candidatus Riesia sp.]|nr:ATP-binding cassette domain-containing protein [Candidatus Riesia sp.]
MSIIKIRDLSFSRERKVIFDKLTLNVEENKITAIMGPSGCGKTTLLKLISGQIRDYSNGFISLFGRDLSIVGDKELYILRRNIGILFQNAALFSDLNVYDNIAFPIREHTDLSESLINDLVLMKLQSVGLRKVESLMPAQLSMGMAKRVALARTIALDPAVIMYDEPFSGQDPISMSILIKLISLLNKFARMTTIIVSHDINEMLELADYIYIINNKEVVAKGTPFEIRANDNYFVRSFISVGSGYEYNKQNLIDDYEKDLFVY